ncbi:prepilin-type N-terminal cleavage/methylation domain-containing protein, partial [Pseudomonas syringae]
MKHAGFTLIELLIVVALVAILANVATPSFK